MSVLVAIKGKDKVVVGVDTRMTSGCDTFIDSYKHRPKALHINKEKTVIVGGVGNIALVDLFCTIMEHHVDAINKIDRRYIVKFIIPELVVCVRDYELMCTSSKNPGFMDGALFLGIKDKGFVIEGNGTVMELVDHTAMGSGEEAAFGSLYTTSHMPMSIEERVYFAVKAAGATVNTVSSTPICGDTKGKGFALLEYPKR